MSVELPPAGHDPVLLKEVLDLLAIAEGMTVVDCTVGRAGHASAIAAKLGPSGLLIGMDADPRNLEYAEERLQSLAGVSPIRLFHANFAQLDEVLREAGVERVDAILADLGLSTNQLFDARYGLSFAEESALDMRIDPRTTVTAGEIVNRWSEETIANLLYEMADERYSRRIARRIIERRKAGAIRTTTELAEVIYQAIGRGRATDKIDPATRTFMALRMAVNEETSNLRKLLSWAPSRLKAGGYLGIISFHSTEDRIVKNAMRETAAAGIVQIVTKKPVVPADEEMNSNPRSRSAKLRVVKRT